MECSQARALLQAHVDGELDPLAASQLADHLSTCAACSAAIVELQALRALIEQHGSYHRAPAQLRQRIRAAIGEGGEKTSIWRTLSSWPWAWINFGAATVASAAFVVTLALHLAQPSSTDRRDDEIVATHFRSLMSGRLADVASSDQHTVKPWFAGKLDFSPPVHDLAQAGFALEGGRVDYVAGRPVAALAYRHHRHVLNLYMWPAPGTQESGLRASSRQGFQMLSWTQQRMVFVAISDMGAQDLAEFGKALRAQLARGGASG